MKKVRHILGKLRGTKRPKWVIFFDTETYEKIHDRKTKELKLKLGYALLTRLDRNGRLTRVDDIVFTVRQELFAWFDTVLTGDQRFYITAHNISFDVRVTGLFDYFTHPAFTRTSFIDAGLNFIARWRRKRTTVVLLNNMQLFNMSLRKLGESIGFEKMTVDFKGATDEELLVYCKRDVMVMVEAWNKLITFIASNDLGNFGMTLASDSLTAFRHRFMRSDVFIHSNAPAIKLERESYHGGRAECFFIGTTNCGPIYSLDVNSMYPAVMRESPVPTKLVRYYQKADFALFERVRADYGYIVEAEIEIEKPYLPVVYNDRLCFPVGRLKGVFAKPEFERALSQGRLKSIGRLAAYREEVIFDTFVDFFYQERRKYKKEGNDAFSFICKLFLNSLYGKFGQRNKVFKKVGVTDTIPDGFHQTLELSSHKWVTYRIYKGVVEREVGYEEGYNAFVAIASYVTALARSKLYSYMETAGRENVFYCDTDSLFVNSTGYMKLLSAIDPSSLGLLKLEGIEKEMTIYGPKRYKFGDKVRSKGIRLDALEVGPNIFEQEQWQGFRGALRSGTPDRVLIHTIRKTLANHYLKGTVTPSGLVVPFHLV